MAVKPVTVHLLVADPDEGRIRGADNALGEPVYYSVACNRGGELPECASGEAKRTSCPKCRAAEVWLETYRHQYKDDPPAPRTVGPPPGGPVPISVLVSPEAVQEEQEARARLEEIVLTPDRQQVHFPPSVEEPVEPPSVEEPVEE